MNVIRESLNRNKNARGRNQFSSRGRSNNLPVFQRIRSGVSASITENGNTKSSTNNGSSSNSVGSGSDPSNNATRSDFVANSTQFTTSSDLNKQNIASDVSSNVNSDNRLLKILGSEKLESERNESITLSHQGNRTSAFDLITPETDNHNQHRSNVLQQNRRDTLSSMFPTASTSDRPIDLRNRAQDTEERQPFKLNVDKIKFPSTVSEKSFDDFDSSYSKREKSIIENIGNTSSNGRNSVSLAGSFKVPKIVQLNRCRSNYTNESFVGDSHISKFVSSPTRSFNVENCDYTPNETIYRRMADSEMRGTCLNSSFTNQKRSTIQQEILDSRKIVHSTTSRPGSTPTLCRIPQGNHQTSTRTSHQQEILDSKSVHTATTRPGSTPTLCKTPQRNQNTPIICDSPARDHHYNGNSFEIPEENLNFANAKRCRTSQRNQNTPIICDSPARDHHYNGNNFEIPEENLNFANAKRRKIVVDDNDNGMQHCRPTSSSSLHTGTHPVGRFRNYEETYLPDMFPNTSSRSPRIDSNTQTQSPHMLVPNTPLQSPCMLPNTRTGSPSMFPNNQTRSPRIFPNNPSGSPRMIPNNTTSSPRMSAFSEKEIQITPKPVNRETTGIFQSSSSDGVVKSIMRNTRDKMSLFTSSDSCRISKTTPVRFRENEKSNQGKNSSESEMTSEFLRTPIVNQFVPDFTCSPERGVQYTPKPADKSIQGLFPLSFFNDSVKVSNPSSSKSTKESIVNSSDHHRTPKSSSDVQRTPTCSSDRQRTPRSATISEDSSHNTILAVTEGRGLARGEVGIAVMDTKRPQLVLCQISDVQTYINTLTKVQIFNPVEILVPSTFAENIQAESLFSKLNDNFPQVNLTSVQRRYFSEREGLSLVQRLCLEDYSTIELIVKHKFYALAALAALITFIEHSHSMIFSKKSLKILYQNAEEVMSIDLDTAKRLELVLSTTGESMHKSLLTVFNYCNTLSGRRFLRANILQPPSNLKVIQKRLECVDELVQDPMLITNLKVELKNFNDVEKLLWLCTQTPTLSVTKAGDMQINYILLLHMTMKSLPAMQECLRETKSERFCKFKQVLADERFKLIWDHLKTYINEDARPAKGFMLSQQQRCFAIKPEVNGLLDVARNSYSKLIDQTSELVKTLSEEHDLPLKWHSSFSKGIHIVLNTSKNKQFKIKDMPPVFVQVTRTRQNITCTTEQLLLLNQRMKSCLQEIQLMSNVILNELVQEIQKDIGCIYKLCEVIAELDMLVCFGVVSSSSDFVSPVFGSRLDLKSSRHPILDVVSSSRPVSNDVTASTEKNLHVITGPNMGGKSIYIRQIALLQIMAQMGCFVPAESAEFRLMDSILSRIGFDDSIEHNASTFTLEMRQISYILQVLETKRRCLVIVDELCRGTSSEEGVAIAWAVCERLAQSNAFSYVTTHFQLLTTMHNTHTNVFNWHFEAEELNDERLRFTHKLLPGVSTVANYGIKLAKMVALPESVMNDIVMLKNKLKQDYQGMMIDTVQEGPRDEIVKTLATKIVDSIVLAKSKDEIIGELKAMMISIDEDRRSTTIVGELNDPNRREAESQQTDEGMELTEEQTEENGATVNQNEEPKSIEIVEQCEGEVQENQSQTNQDVIVTGENEESIEIEPEEEDEELNDIEEISESSTQKAVKEQVSKGSEYCNVEERLEKMDEQTKDDEPQNRDGDGEVEESNGNTEDINNNSQIITKQQCANLSSQELYDILNTQHEGQTK